MGNRGAILVLPTSTAGQQGPVAAWTSAAGWASAVRRVLGEVWLTTPDGLVEPHDARQRGSSPALSPRAAIPWHRRVPIPVTTAIKDVRQWQRGRAFSVDPLGPWQGHDISFVWQRHELFHDAGVRLARALGVPSVLFVPATLVWEAREWGVRRPGWNRWVERHGEMAVLRGADLVACGSQIVAEQARRLGVRADRIIVTPTGVDLDLFGGRRDVEASAPLRRELGLSDRFVIGWVGSFRPFHALDAAVDAASRVEGATLLLIGDGPERAGVEALARVRGVQVVTTGTVPHTELPRYLGAMDVGLVVTAPGQTFHYSPLKLAEYLAAGLPVVAPRVTQIAARVQDGTQALLVAPGDPDALVRALCRLRDDPELRNRMTASAQSAAAEWSWDRQVERVLAALP